MATSAAVCEDCEGTGFVTEDAFRKCHNCNGEGSCEAGKGNRYVCTVCGGEGECPITREQKCTRCKGTGKSSKQAAKVVGRAADSRQAPRSVAPPAGAGVTDGDDEDGDEETGNATASGATGRQQKAKASSAQNQAKQSQSDRPHGINWENGVGLHINVTVGIPALLNFVGTVFVLFGFVLLLQKTLLWWLLGSIVAAIGISCLLKANAQRCASSLKTLMPST
eukprot:CAMPEP_0115280696 /NCGR_PEP_ID=MMETSP0270-20121206/58929_1 /TAXON_ID=71861 /ORGANISM="Scrippsiella trochoidea, Strain CCMP3099" /LENGTH=222 /DNA_ID=CAMNT_0002697457 /DNA_START=66 /DNA_END=730 /DNA_ORIENTATION=+